MPNTTSRLSLAEPLTSDASSELRLSITNHATTLDATVLYTSGTISAMPAANTLEAGHRYYATDVGQELYNTGTSWIPVSSATPIGSVTQYAGSSDPTDADGTTRWLICDGRAISRTTYATLFTKTSTTYGTGNGSTTFNIPDLRGRVPVGADPTGVHLPSGEPALGAAGGEEKHTLVTGELASHAHTFDGAGGTVPASTSGFVWGADVVAGGSVSAAYTTGAWLSGGITATDSSGSGSPHNNLQPYLAVNHIIKVL